MLFMVKMFSLVNYILKVFNIVQKPLKEVFECIL